VGRSLHAWCGEQLMASLLNDLHAALEPARVLGPEASAAVRATVDYTGVRDRQPSVVIRPVSFDEVAIALRVISAHDVPVSVLGGGHGPRNMFDGVACLDLRSIPVEVSSTSATVTVNGSALAKDLLSVNPSMVVPVGVAFTPGMGLMTTGGIGGLTRSLGLTIDSLLSLEMLDGSGRPFTVDACTDPELWWAVRGAAARFGVVVKATFALHAVAEVTETAMVVRATSLKEWARQAALLPRDTSVSLAMVPATDGGAPLVLLDEVTIGPAPRGAAALMSAGNENVTSRTATHPYRELSIFDVPRGPGHEPPELDDRRWQSISMLVTAAGAEEVIDDLLLLLSDAPTPWSWIEVQHIGGAMADVADSETAFWGRAAEHSVVVTPVWPADADDDTFDSCQRWLQLARELLAPVCVGVYAADIRPDVPGYHSLREVFGDNLDRLLNVANRVDPHGRFRLAPPFV